ncbi:helix-turn-helix domain-containing protein [Candidatus Leptofilum sp.]|uniref:helix-turn-helix domain-containing protein n=1 Tax=Candidatus Leptofilum sp. TaxID=3241576 RepID=UPI003B5CB286
MTRLEELLPLLAQLVEVDGEIKTLADLAALDGRSPFHLQRIFTAEVGESPLQFSRRVRLQRAAAALLVTQKSVLEVALDAGFDSHEGFSRAFRAMFSQSPSKFREQQRATFNHFVHHYRLHLETANRTAPCITLYRVSVGGKPKSKTKKGENMSYEITKKTIAETPFLYMRNQVKPEEIATALANMLGPVFQYATAQGIPFAGPPTTRYISFGPGLATIEAGMPVAGPAEGSGEIMAGSLAGGDVVSTIHKGPYDTLNLGYEAIQQWMIENNEEASGAPWESYITDPGEVPDPAEWLTEIVQPLKGA